MIPHTLRHVVIQDMRQTPPRSAYNKKENICVESNISLKQFLIFFVSIVPIFSATVFLNLINIFCIFFVIFRPAAGFLTALLYYLRHNTRTICLSMILQD